MFEQRGFVTRLDPCTQHSMARHRDAVVGRMTWTSILALRRPSAPCKAAAAPAAVGLVLLAVNLSASMTARCMRACTRYNVATEWCQGNCAHCHTPQTQKSRFCLSRQKPPVLKFSGGVRANHTGVSAPAAADCVPRQLLMSVAQYLCQCTPARQHEQQQSAAWRERNQESARCEPCPGSASKTPLSAVTVTRA